MNLRASHLLFSFNRWEKKDDIINILNSGTHLIIDRYAFSGYCYSVCNVSYIFYSNIKKFHFQKFMIRDWTRNGH